VSLKQSGLGLDGARHTIVRTIQIARAARGAACAGQASVESSWPGPKPDSHSAFHLPSKVGSLAMFLAMGRASSSVSARAILGAVNVDDAVFPVRAPLPRRVTHGGLLQFR
jgi:hypothetical protein